ncbi:hypothetical protein D3C80_1424900 [compost metagenome]
MTCNVMGSDKRFIDRKSKAFSCHDADEQRSDKPRPLSNSNCRELFYRDACLFYSLLKHERNALYMFSGSNLRYYSTKHLVRLNLTGN